MTTTKKPAARAKTSKKHPAKKTAAAPKVAKAKQAPVASFRVAKPEQPFFTFRITRQTLYWLILSVAVLSLGVWMITINQRVQEIYDQIDATQAAGLQSRAQLNQKLNQSGDDH